MKTLLISLLCLALAGCTSINGYISKVTGAQATAEKQIAALRLDYDSRLAVKTTEIERARDKVVVDLKAQMVAAVNGLYFADQVFQTVLSPDRVEILMDNGVKESWQALGNQSPDYETLVKINARIKKELDATQTSLADLKKSHETVINENQKFVDQEIQDEVDLAAALKAKGEIEADYRTKLDAKQNELITLTNQKAQLETQRADDRVAIQAAKTKASAVLGVIALACLAGVIWLPIGKQGLAVFGGLCGAAAVAIWYIQPWMVMAGIGLVVIILGAWALSKLHVADRASTNVIRAIQSIKDTSKADYDKVVAPVLNTWNVVYDKSGTPIPDQQAIQHIDQTLMKVGDK